MTDARTAEASIREFLRIAERDTYCYHDATNALDGMVARIAELEERSPEGPWIADGRSAKAAAAAWAKKAKEKR